MYPGYSLRVEEYRHPHEFPVRMTYLAIALLGILVLFVLNWISSLSILFGLGIIFLTWYLSLRSSQSCTCKSNSISGNLSIGRSCCS